MIDKKILSYIVMLLFFIALATMTFYHKRQYEQTKTFLRDISPQEITLFRIYPRHSRPVKTFVEFTMPDQLIEDFFQSLTDIHSANPSNDGVASWDHSWFLEVATERGEVQISFHIPFMERQHVIGRLGRFRKTSAVFYGDFQSKQLFQWYQKHRYRWLDPDEQQQPLNSPN